MPEDNDYKEILSGTVKEAKQKVRELDSPDYRELLRLEKEGKDRETLKDFLNRNVDSLKGDDDEEETVEKSEPEQEESGNKLSDMSAKKLLLLGGLSGLLLGLLVGFALSPGMAAQGQPDEAKSALEELVAAQNINGTADVGEPVRKHGLYMFNVSMTQETPNGTQTGHQSFYVTQDAELLIPVISNPFVGNIPMNIEETLAQQRQARQQQNQQPAPQEQEQ